MNTKLDLMVSALTAFIISAGGALGVVGLAAGSQIAFGKTALLSAAALGAVSAAKDCRSFLKLPPVAANGIATTTTTTTTPPAL